MLVCNVSLRPVRSAIAAAIIETATAADDSGTGNVVFATLVDDPASVAEIVDAYLGQIMLEAASAADVFDGAIPAVYAVNIVEATTASDAPAGIVGVPYATFDGTATGVTLSNGNLTATHINTSTAQGARSTSNKTSGKYYFEITVGATHGGGDNAGVILSTGSYTDMTNGNNCSVSFLTFASGVIYSNNAAGNNSGGPYGAGDIVRCAIDLDNRKVWFSRGITGIWNNDVSANPATNTNGMPMASGSFAPAVQFGSGASASGDNMTANFGTTSFTYTAPSGFGNWPA